MVRLWRQKCRSWCVRLSASAHSPTAMPTSDSSGCVSESADYVLQSCLPLRAQPLALLATLKSRLLAARSAMIERRRMLGAHRQVRLRPVEAPILAPLAVVYSLNLVL